MSKMSYSSASMGSGSRTARRTVEFGRTYVVRPKAKHQATIVWLHGLGDNGSSWSQLLDNLPLPNVSIYQPFVFSFFALFLKMAFGDSKTVTFLQIKWICPTAPTRPVTALGGFPCAAWFDEGELSEDGPNDVEGLDASIAHIANLLSTEPSDACFAQGKYGNGNPYPINLKAVVGLSGWLPGARNLRNKIGGSTDAARRAASLPILLCHGLCDEVVPYGYGERSSQMMSSAGFRYVSFKSYEGLGHYTVPKEMEEVCQWLNARLGA
ncbi:Phospholipase/carboxylesterase/thioesterase [Cynara cardunculus var. scolymus]|uniref:Phospholipase/carboxylesterase/thioesterase n=1 Tax=Cynara cardunculus var. scolymus TaxID=59895 RepID=A0A103YBF9_CYNCS|nr:Phospholipase/carboxylesterase/thioesterase [Cynara cardunculus var. scolymus]